MHKISKFLMFVICAIVISFCTACLKGNFKLKKLTGSFWEPDVAIPLVNSSMTLNNILTLSNINNNFSIDADNFITLVYRGNLLSVRADEALKIPDQPIDSNFTFPSALTPGFDALPAQDTFLLPNALQGDFAFNAGPNGAYIDSMSLKTCLFALNLISGFQHQLLVNISIPGARKNGIPFSTEVIIPAAGGSPITRSANFSLAGYRINLNQNGVPNRLKINFGLKIIKTNTTIQPGQDNLGIVMSLSNISFKNLFGSIGQQSLSPNIDTIPITLFNNSLMGGSIAFQNATLGINISNAFGLPIEGEFQQIEGYNPISSTPVTPLLSPVLNNSLPINIPTQIGQTATSSLSIGSSNSNINQVLANLPRFLIYKINAQSNPPPPATQMQNFIEDSSRFKVDLDINIPLEGTLKNLIFQDTINFKFKEVEELQSLALKLSLTNGFPIESKVQVYFADSLGSLVDSLLEDNVVLASALVGSNGRVTAPTEKNTEINYPAEKISRLGRVRKIYVKATTSTLDNGSRNVKIYSDYRIDLKISGRAKLKFEL